MKAKTFSVIHQGEGLRRVLKMLKGISWGGVVWYWVPLLTYASAMFYLSSQPIQGQEIAVYIKAVKSFMYAEGTNIPIGFDKVLHVIEYAILGVLTFRALRYARMGQSEVTIALLSIMGIVVFGLTDEFHQWFTPFRHVDGWDLMADALGGTLGVSAWQGALNIPVVRLLEKRIPLQLQLALGIPVLKL